MIEKDYLIKQLKNLGDRVVVDKKWKKEQRQFLLSQLNAQLDDIEGIGISKELKILSYFQTLLKPVVLLLVFVLGSGWLSVMASENSLPGDLLYPVKINSEKIEIALTFDKAKEAELHMEAAKKRVEEIQELKKQDLVEPEIVQETYDRVKVSVGDAQAVLKELKEDNAVVESVIEESEALMQAANVIDEGLKVISNNLDTLSDDVLEENIIGGDAPVEVPEDLLVGLEDLNSDVDLIVNEMVTDTAVVESEEVKGAVSDIIERAAEEINKDTETIMHDHDLEEDNDVSVDEEVIDDEVLDTEVLDTEALDTEAFDTEALDTEALDTEEVISEKLASEDVVISDDILMKIDNILTSELIEEGLLISSKELNDLLTKEVVVLLEEGEIDKALEFLRKGQELTVKMQEAVIVENQSGDDLSAEIVIEEEPVEETVALDEESIEGGEEMQEQEAVIEDEEPAEETVVLEEEVVEGEVVEEDIVDSNIEVETVETEDIVSPVEESTETIVE